MKYFVILLILIVFFTVNTTYASSPPTIDFEFVGLNDTYQLGEKFVIKFEKTTKEPCPSYYITITKDGHPESKITHGHEPLCAISGPVEPYLFSDEYSKLELFDSAGTYHIEIQMDESKILKKIKIVDKSFSIIEKQVKYVIPYQITGGTINNMKLNCDPPSLVVSVSSSDAGILKIDFPRKMIGGIFNVLVNEKEWTDDGQTSLDGNILTVTFPDNTHTIEVMGSYQISSNNDGVCDVVHNPPYSYILSPLKQYNLGIRYPEIICKDGLELIGKSTHGTPACVKPETKTELIERGWAKNEKNQDNTTVSFSFCGAKSSWENGVCLEDQFPKIDSLRPEDRLQVRHSAGYTTVEITLSSWDEYNEWEERRGSEHEAMPPILITENNINPIVFDLLFKMWNFTDYEVSRYDNNLFIKKIQKDYSVLNHHGIHDWLESEFNKQYGEKIDGSFSNHFEFRDKVYSVTMSAAD